MIVINLYREGHSHCNLGCDEGEPRWYIHQGPPEYGRSCDYREQVTIIAYHSL